MHHFCIAAGLLACMTSANAGLDIFTTVTELKDRPQH